MFLGYLGNQVLCGRAEQNEEGQNLAATLFLFGEFSLRRLWGIDKKCPGVSSFSVLRKGAIEGHGPAVDVTPGAS